MFSTLDLWQAYHQLLWPWAEEDRHKTAFTWQGTQYQFRGAPFGLKTLPLWCDDHMSPTMMPHLAGFSLTHAFV